MAKYNQAIVKAICSIIEKDTYTISEICRAVNIDVATYFRWQAEKPEFQAAVQEAKLKFDELLVAKAKRSLVKKIDGYEVEETKIVYMPSKNDSAKPTVKEKTVTKKHFQPDTASIIFTLTNKVPDEYKHRQTVDTKVSMAMKVDELTDDQLDLVIQQVLAQSNGKSEISK